MCIKIISSQSSTVQSPSNTTYKHTNQYFTLTPILKIINTITNCKFTSPTMHKILIKRLKYLMRDLVIENNIANCIYHLLK